MADELSLAQYGEYAYDTGEVWTIEDVLANDKIRWKPIGQEFSEGLSYNTVWIKIPIPKEALAYKDTRVLSITNHLLNRVWVYIVKDKTLLNGAILGDHVRIEQRNIKVSDILWQLPNGWQKASHIYVHIKTDSFLQTHFKIKSVAASIEDQSARYWMLGLFYGAIVIMALYNLFVFSQVKDIRYLYYTSYVFSVGMFHAAMDGLPYFVLSDVYAQRVDRMSVYFVIFANIFGILFVTSFLKIQERIILRGLRTLIYTFLVAFVIEIIEHGHISSLYSMTMSIVSSFTVAYITIRSWIKGSIHARYLALAWIALLISVPIYALTLNGLIPHNVYTLNSLRFGVVLELALLSFSLAHRINLLRQERLDLQRRLSKELGALVQEKTADLEAANKKLQELSETDALTGLKNRAYFDIAIKEEIARAQRNKSTMTVLIADLDHFKNINDTLGHSAGDFCLKHFASVFDSRLTRAIDIACRYGGEEFVAILPETDMEGALKVAEKIREGLENSHIEFEGKPIDLSVSIGVYATTTLHTSSANDWVSKADEALYHAKTRRNQVAYFSESGTLEFSDAPDSEVEN